MDGNVVIQQTPKNESTTKAASNVRSSQNQKGSATKQSYANNKAIPASRKGNKTSIQPQPSLNSDENDYAADDFEDNEDHHHANANSEDDNEPTIPKNESAQKNVSSIQRKQKNVISKKKAGGTPIGHDIEYN